MTTPSHRLVFDLRGHTARGCQTTRRLVILIDGVAVWPVPGDETARLDIQIDDLLAHLTDHWQTLMLRQTCRQPSPTGSRKRFAASKTPTTSPAPSAASMVCRRSGFCGQDRTSLGRRAAGMIVSRELV
ncbi:hypothetical protein WI697_26700 [Tistrella mobilis]|uniref:hypothetical protein n=1 Tax=Tistrella mobilis TaxID=171437 RepID=UPI0031F6D71D